VTKSRELEGTST